MGLNWGLMKLKDPYLRTNGSGVLDEDDCMRIRRRDQRGHEAGR